MNSISYFLFIMIFNLLTTKIAFSQQDKNSGLCSICSYLCSKSRDREINIPIENESRSIPIFYLNNGFESESKIELSVKLNSNNSQLFIHMSYENSWTYFSEYYDKNGLYRLSVHNKNPFYFVISSSLSILNNHREIIYLDYSLEQFTTYKIQIISESTQIITNILNAQNKILGVYYIQHDGVNPSMKKKIYGLLDGGFEIMNAKYFPVRGKVFDPDLMFSCLNTLNTKIETLKESLEKYHNKSLEANHQNNIPKSSASSS